MSRVLMTVDAISGVWRYALELATALLAHDVETVLAVLGPEPSGSRMRAAKSIPRLRVEVGYLPLETAEDEADFAATARWAQRLVRRYDPDLIHVNGLAHAALPWQRPIVCTAHSEPLSRWQALHHGELVGQDDPCYRERAMRGISAAHAVTAPSGELLRQLARTYRPLPGAAVIPYGASPDGRPRGPKEALVLGVGRLWDEAKNLRVLATAAPSISWPVAIAGSSSAPDGRQAFLPSVLSLGQLDDHQVAAWMGRARIFALPALYEPFGFSVLEAAIAGCALILGDIPSLREVWGDAAIYVPPDDPEALAIAVGSCAVDAEYCAERAAAARRRATGFGAEQMASSYLALYRRAAQLQRAAARPSRERAPIVRRAPIAALGASA